MKHSFPVDQFDRINAHPARFMLIEQVPLTYEETTFPLQLAPAVGDERNIVFLDLETTGLDAEQDDIFELGLVMGEYSPSTSKVTSILGAMSVLEDPGKPISEEITRITGITDADVAGKRFDEALIAEWFANDPLVVAHNARFDRPFFDKRFPTLERAGWACSYAEIDWKTLGYESGKLEYLLLKHGFFYSGHRAEVDCLATAWLLHFNQEAFPALLANARRKTVVVRAFGSPYEAKDTLKDRDYKWHPGDSGSNKCWWTTVYESDLANEQAFLAQCWHGGDEQSQYTTQTARDRFKAVMT